MTKYRRTKKNKILNGGKYLGEGSYGCVVSPALPCDKKQITKTLKTTHYVSKLIIAPDENDNEEIDISNKLKRLDPKQYYFITFEDVCRIKKIPDNRSNTVKVSYQNNSLETYKFLNNKKHDKKYCGIDLRLNPINIIMPYGGYDLTNIIDNKHKQPHLQFTRKMLIKHFKLCFKHLLIGIKKMHDARIVNRDIKLDNIMVNYDVNQQITQIKESLPQTKESLQQTKQNEFKNMKIRFIDFGLSTILTPEYCQRLDNIDVRGTLGFISPELSISYFVNMNKKYENIIHKINKELKPMLNSFKDSVIISGFDNLNLELYKKIMEEFKTKEILKNFFGTDENKYNGYLQKGDIFSLGITIYVFLDEYKYYFKTSNSSNINLKNSKLVNLLHNMIKIDPDKRYNVIQCLKHSYFY